MLFAGCGRQVQPQPLRLAAPPWSDGEISRYEITDRRGDSLGQAQIEWRAGAPGDPSGWRVIRTITAQGNQEVVDLAIRSDLRPISSTFTLTTAQGSESVAAIYNAGVVNMTLLSKQGIMTTEQRNAPTDAFESTLIASLLRALPLSAGYVTRFTLFTPYTGYLETALVQISEAEVITVPAGQFTSWPVEVRVGENITQVWIGADAPHPLLKWIDGRARAEFALTTE